MGRALRTFLPAGLAAGLLLGVGPDQAIGANESNAETVKAGEEVTFDLKKGNCLSCHAIGDGEAPGTIGPKLASMKARFPDRDKLREQIWDARINDPHSIMPPFGKHNILSDKEIDQIIDYLYTL